MGYIAPIDDITFLLSDVFAFDELMQELPGYGDVNAELAVAILDEAGKFCAGVLEPLNRTGDEEGCRLEGGSVRTPKGFSQAYRSFADAGWCGLSGNPDFGGQGLPRTVQVLLDEMLSSSNVSFGLFPGLTRGAVEAIEQHACDEIKRDYLPKMISGEWTGAMALTEASAGTDLGLLSTRAVPTECGAYKITGTKIFISSGDHDFGGNIIHLVLARLPDAPEGVKGISLFLVPKFLIHEDGSVGERNGVSVGSLESKMGIHAQPTCVMNYDGARGWLLAEPGRGLAAMFTMMNAERMFVGMQGLGIAEAAYQKAVRYARDRLQGRSLDGRRSPVPIIEHPDVRRMLLSGRAFIDAARALAIWASMQMDIAQRHPDERERLRASGFVALLTPVVKAAFTDFGFETAVASQQVLGGHGYIREWGSEQFVRDARITQIYEGTNGVQAMDLVTRKLPMESGDLVIRFFETVKQDLQAASLSGLSEEIAYATARSLDRLERATLSLLSIDSPSISNASANAYLRLFALTTFGWMWSRMASKASEVETRVAKRKLCVARFFAKQMLPATIGLAEMIGESAVSGMDLADDDF